MVPVRDKREMGVVTNSEDCLLRVNDPSVARLANFRNSSGSLPAPSPTDRIILARKSQFAFSILGVSEGNTELVLEGADTKPTALLVSVKQRIVKRFALCFLSDIRRSTSRPKDDAATIMVGVAETYLQQANLELQAVALTTEVVVPLNLGNPLFVGRNQILFAISDATPAHLFTAADVIVYCCWDVEDRRPLGDLGITRGKRTFMQDGGNASDFQTRMTFAHEIGHAFGLKHNGNADSLMFPNDAARSSKLLQFEIDALNASGTIP
jgi:Matrixin